MIAPSIRWHSVVYGLRGLRSVSLEEDGKKSGFLLCRMAARLPVWGMHKPWITST